MPEVRNPGLGAGQVAQLSTTTILTAAQIRALSTTPVSLVQAPGAGKIIVPIGAAVVYKFGTRAYLVPVAAVDSMGLFYGSTIDNPIGAFSNAVSGASSTFSFQGSYSGPINILPGDDNTAINLVSQFSYAIGPIATATLGAGGAGYAANDTGTIATGSGDATYQVLTVDGGGAVLTFLITGAGTRYATGNGQATATGGAQPGVGTGFTVNITAVTPGDGTLKVVTYYQILPVP